MTKLKISAAIAAILFAGPAVAEGDAEAGEKLFKKCKGCHMIASPDEVLFKGGKTGPNLYGVLGRPMGSVEGFKYGDGLTAAFEAGLVWDEAAIAGFVTDPKTYLRDVTGDDSVKSKMTLKLKKGSDDIVAFLATFSPVAPEEIVNEESTEAPAASE